MKLFADDVKLYSSFTHSLHDLQVVCDRLATYSRKWQLRIAFDKCNRDNVNVTVCSSKYKIGAHVLRWSDETHDLGVIIDKETKF